MARVLIVDDEPEICELFALEFVEAGFEVQTAHNGRDALVKLQDSSFDFVVSDVRMPGGDGVELLDNLQKLKVPRPPLIFVTGFADISEQDAIEKGALKVFAKPIDVQIVLDFVKAQLQRSS